MRREDTPSIHEDKGQAMLLPRSYPLARLLFEVYVAVLLGLVILAILTPEVVSARQAARRSACVNNLFQHSGCHPVVVYLEGGRIVRLSSCRACASHLGVRINFVDEKDGKPLDGEQAIQEGLCSSEQLSMGENSASPTTPSPVAIEWVAGARPFAEA